MAANAGQNGLGERVARVTSDVDLGRCARLKLAVTELQLAGHHLDDEQAVGDIPRGRPAVAVVFHTGFVEVLDGARTAWSLGVGFRLRVLTV